MIKSTTKHGRRDWMKQVITEVSPQAVVRSDPDGEALAGVGPRQH